MSHFTKEFIRKIELLHSSALPLFIPQVTPMVNDIEALWAFFVVAKSIHFKTLLNVDYCWSNVVIWIKFKAHDVTYSLREC